MKTLEFYVSQTITYDHVEEIIVGALEGGSNYWYLLKDIPGRVDKSQPASEYIAEKLFNDPEFALNVYDVENEDEVLGTITQGSLIKALGIAHKEYHHHFESLMEGTGDADTDDVLFQLAVLGEVVFG